MPVRLPQISQLREIADRYGLSLSDEDLGSFQGIIAGILPAYAQIERIPHSTPKTKYPRLPGHRPAPEDNLLNAWCWRCSIHGATEGLLAGKTVAIKDSVAVAGVPMTNGSQLLDGYVPDVDATLVTRVLDAGGTIIGKAAGEDLGFSGGSHTCVTGPIHNPWDPTRSAGGSSGGSAVLVAEGTVNLSVGGDQGGSLREPSAWCGIVGHKPTFGLVPYTGIFPLELTLDHVGPMARTVADVAAFLEAIAGSDGMDPRQPPDIHPEPYTKKITNPPQRLRVALVTEGFGWPEYSENDVDEIVRNAAHLLEKAGASVYDVSIPLHRSGYNIWTTIAYEGGTRHMIKGAGVGTNGKGYYATSLLEHFTRGLRTRAQDLPDTVKLLWLLGEYLQEHYHGHYYALGQNLAPTLRAAYDNALAEADVLVMPTVPTKATLIPAPTATREESMVCTMGMGVNTAPFGVTGHPSITVPCGLSAGLPIGMMLIGRHWEDTRVLQVAQVFEEQVGGFDRLIGNPESSTSGI